MIVMHLFTAHPQAQGETYAAHAKVAYTIGTMCLQAGTMALIHGVFPFFFETGASTKLKEIHEYLDAKNRH